MDLADAGWYMPGAGITVRKIRPTTNGANFIGDLETGAQGYVAIFTMEIWSLLPRQGPTYGLVILRNSLCSI